MELKPDGKWRHRLQIGGRSQVHVSREEAYRIPHGVVEYLAVCSQQKQDPNQKNPTQNSGIQKCTK
jgi:hypothetical protein